MGLFTAERQLMEQPDLLDKRHFNKDMKDTKDMGVSHINTSFTG